MLEQVGAALRNTREQKALSDESCIAAVWTSGIISQTDKAVTRKSRH
jgi:hypothetical protein